MYSEYKEIIASSDTNKWPEYGVEQNKEMTEKKNKFIGTNKNTKEKPFRLFKNGGRIKEIKCLFGKEEEIEG